MKRDADQIKCDYCWKSGQKFVIIVGFRLFS